MSGGFYNYYLCYPEDTDGKDNYENEEKTLLNILGDNYNKYFVNVIMICTTYFRYICYHSENFAEKLNKKWAHISNSDLFNPRYGLDILDYLCDY